MTPARSCPLIVASLATAPFLLSVTAQAAVVPGQIVARSGDIPEGAAAPLETIDPPFVEAGGAVAFGGALSNGTRYIFRDGEIIWLGSADPAIVGGSPDSVGTTNAGRRFVYSPLVDGGEDENNAELDALYTHRGLLGQALEDAPGLPPGTIATFYNRPTMTYTGTTYWVVGLNAMGGEDEATRALVYSPSGAAADAQVRLQSGMVEPIALAEGPEAVRLGYRVSPLSGHLIARVTLDSGAEAVYVEQTIDDMVAGSVVATAGELISPAEDWEEFTMVAINDAGGYAFAGTTTAEMNDSVIRYGEEIVLQEGDSVAGVDLVGVATVDLIALNDDVLVHGWRYSGTKSVFYSCDPINLGTTSTALVSRDDELDLDDDGIGDATIINIQATQTAPTQAIARDGSVYLAVQLDQEGVTRDAIVRFQASCCGNGFLDPDEECDDANGDGGDGCSAQCVVEPEACGDDNFDIDLGEECDDGNTDDSDGCTSACRLATCGDGYVWAELEECDDGNLDNDDECRADCTLPVCGDGVRAIGLEACDDGNDSNFDDCVACEPAFCGDGIIRVGLEVCDDGNNINDDGCSNVCQEPQCGDGILHGGELCDDGNNVNDDACTNACTLPTCGDTIQQMGEECDDGNDSNEDACLNTCIASFCGDGFIQKGELCDDRNASDNDACLSTCVPASCGDGFTLTGVEECDDGNDVDNDSCLSDCTAAVCGDGILRPDTEECDDGNTEDDEECLSDCSLPGSGTTTGDDTTGSDSTGDDTTGSTTSGTGPGTPPFSTSEGGLDDTTGVIDPDPTAPGSTSGIDPGSIPLDDDGGCNCSTTRRDTPLRNLLGGLLTLGVFGLRRRRRR